MEVFKKLHNFNSVVSSTEFKANSLYRWISNAGYYRYEHKYSHNIKDKKHTSLNSCSNFLSSRHWLSRFSCWDQKVSNPFSVSSSWSSNLNEKLTRKYRFWELNQLKIMHIKKYRKFELIKLFYLYHIDSIWHLI